MLILHTIAHQLLHINVNDTWESGCSEVASCPTKLTELHTKLKGNINANTPGSIQTIF